MTDAITTGCYESRQIHRIRADLAYLEQITPGVPGLGEDDWDAVVAMPGRRVITAAIAGRLVGFVLCLFGDAGFEPDLAAVGVSLSAEESHAFTRSALWVRSLIVAPAAGNLGVSQHLLDAACREQADGRIFAVLSGHHPANRVARAEGWHEVMRSSSGAQLLVGPDHPVLTAMLLRA